MERGIPEALDCLDRDHDFLLKGDVFTTDFLEMWVNHKRKEHDALRLRPHGEDGPLASTLEAWRDYYRTGGGAHGFQDSRVLQDRGREGRQRRRHQTPPDTHDQAARHDPVYDRLSEMREFSDLRHRYRRFVFPASIAFAITRIVWPRVTLRSAILRAIAAAAIVYIPLPPFEWEAQRSFIVDTYAPLVTGESGQLRSMIEDTLQSEFTRADLSTILPDDYRHMNLEDLAYALWLRSDLSKWRVPAVITVRDEFTGTPISRFGVGIPQFEDLGDEGDGEVLQVGSLKRVLLHHEFQLTAWGTTIAEGSVHVVNPAEPGATAFADIYRDFFETDPIETGGLQPQPVPAVYDRAGAPKSTVIVRLPQKPSWYFQRLAPGAGLWARSPYREASMIYVRRTEEALYAFPLQLATVGQQIRQAGGVAIWALIGATLALLSQSLPSLGSFLRRIRHGRLVFRARTSLYLTGVIILPLIVFVIFVRAYLAGRLESEYVDRGQTALNAAQRVIEDYLASQQVAGPPEQVLDDAILSWLARVIGHDLHLYRDDELVSSSRRDLFAAHVESERLPGDGVGEPACQLRVAGEVERRARSCTGFEKQVRDGATGKGARANDTFAGAAQECLGAVEQFRHLLPIQTAEGQEMPQTAVGRELKLGFIAQVRVGPGTRGGTIEKFGDGH